jgi:hypothetical protein
MHDVMMIVGFCILAAGIVGSRILSERAFRKLDSETKVRIMDEFSSMRIWNIVPVVAILVLMLAGNAFYAGHEMPVFGLFLLAMVAYFVFTHRMIRNKMLKVQVPPDYLRTFLLSRWISYSTLMIMLVVILGGAVWSALSRCE